jgi:hypothetical protein
MRDALFGLAVLFASTAVSAADFGHTRKDRTQINDAFNAMTDMCASNFGFSRLQKKADGVMVDKMEAYLLLAPSADYVIGQWANIAHDSHALDRAKNDDALANRLADALIAAEKDPDSYDRAEALWLETFKAPVETVVSACRAAAADPFVGANYLTGNGSADRYDDELKKRFADSLRNVK